MIGFIVSIIVFIAAIGVLLWGVAKKESAGSIIGIVGILLAIIVMVISCVGVVPTGYTGILTTFGAVQDRTLSPGINFIAPWQNVVTMDNRAQKVEITTQAFSSDIQQVDISMSVNYCIGQETARELYKTVGKNTFSQKPYPKKPQIPTIRSQCTVYPLISLRQNVPGYAFHTLTHTKELILQTPHPTSGPN